MALSLFIGLHSAVKVRPCAPLTLAPSIVVSSWAPANRFPTMLPTMCRVSIHFAFVKVFASSFPYPSPNTFCEKLSFQRLNSIMPDSKRILVAGGGGFIGSHLAKRLKDAGHWVRVADWNRNAYFEESEFCDDYHLVKRGFKRICSLDGLILILWCVCVCVGRPS